MTGALIGSATGILLVALTHEHGIDYATLTGGGPSSVAFGGLNWSLTIYPTLAAIDVIRVVVAVIITSLVASAWPAARVARLEPATALRN